MTRVRSKFKEWLLKNIEIDQSVYFFMKKIVWILTEWLFFRFHFYDYSKSVDQDSHILYEYDSNVSKYCHIYSTQLVPKSKDNDQVDQRPCWSEYKYHQHAVLYEFKKGRWINKYTSQNKFNNRKTCTLLL